MSSFARVAVAATTALAGICPFATSTSNMSMLDSLSLEEDGSDAAPVESYLNFVLEKPVGKVPYPTRYDDDVSDVGAAD